MRFIDSIPDAILDRSPEELIGALLIAGAIAIVAAGLYALNRRKSIPSPSIVGALSLAAGASCTALAAGYIEHAETNRTSGSAANHPAPERRPPGGPGRVTPPPPWNFSGSGWSSGFHIVVAADENRDGRLTPEEAARLVRKADSDGDGSVDFRDIDRLIVSRFRPRSQPPGLTAGEPNDRGGTLR
jgi:hypothetical protein